MTPLDSDEQNEQGITNDEGAWLYLAFCIASAKHPISKMPVVAMDFGKGYQKLKE